MDDRRRRFEAQVLPHLDAAYRFARWLAHSPQGADDLVQDAVLRAYRGFDALRSEDAKAWLMTIVRHCHFTACEQAKRQILVPLPEEHDALDGHALVATELGPESASILHDEERALVALIAALPDDYREVLLLREIEGLEYRQIATVINVPLGTVMSRLARARAALRKQWLRQVDGEKRAVP
jgi:RNA polymerase sigma factor (sigma-70 family)